MLFRKKFADPRVRAKSTRIDHLGKFEFVVASTVVR